MHCLHRLRNNSLSQYSEPCRCPSGLWRCAPSGRTYWHSLLSSVQCALLGTIFVKATPKCPVFTCWKKNISGLLDLPVQSPVSTQNNLPCTSKFLLHHWPWGEEDSRSVHVSLLLSLLCREDLLPRGRATLGHCVWHHALVCSDELKVVIRGFSVPWNSLQDMSLAQICSATDLVGPSTKPFPYGSVDNSDSLAALVNWWHHWSISYSSFWHQIIQRTFLFLRLIQ